MNYLQLFMPLVFAILYRCRGGYIPLNDTTLARITYWAIPCALWGYLSFGILGILCGLGAYLGLLISHAPFQADNKWNSITGMMGIGIARAFLILLPVSTYGVLPLATLGLLSGIAYYIGWTFMSKLDSGIHYPNGFASTGGEWAEVLTGAVFGLIFFIASI